jgi:acyl carrier protein
MDTVLERIKSLIASKLSLDVHHIDYSKPLEDLGIDSLDLVELLMDIEDEFHIQFSNDELASYKTLGDVNKGLQLKLKK